MQFARTRTIMTAPGEQIPKQSITKPIVMVASAVRNFFEWLEGLLALNNYALNRGGNEVNQ